MKRIKDDTSSNGKLLYAGEHLTCNHFLRDVGSGFTLQKVEKGQSMNSLLSPQYHNLLFFLNGMCTVSCNNYTNRNFCEGEMVLVPRFAKFSGKADTPLLVLIMAFNQPQSGCDRLVLQNYHVLCHEMLYDFHPLDIRPPLNQFIELLCFT